MYIAMKAAEQQAAQMLAQRPQPFVLPRRPLVLMRGVMRLMPPLAVRWQGRIVRESGLFDTAWYLAQYPDVKAAGVDPVRHFLRWAAADLRDPGPRFSTRAYLLASPDVKAAGINPLVHYLTTGWAENRPIHPAEASK